MRQFQDQHVAESLRAGFAGVRGQCQFRLLWPAAQVQTKIVQKQVPKRREAVQRGGQTACLALHGHKMLQGARPYRAAPESHHFVASLRRGKLIKAGDFIKRDALCGHHRAGLQT